MEKSIKLRLLFSILAGIGLASASNSTSSATTPSPATTKTPKTDPCTYTWVKSTGGRSPGGVPICSSSVEGCQERCIDDIACTGVDYDSDGGCYLLYTGGVAQGIGTGYEHYDLVRDCPGPCLPACTLPILAQQGDGTGGFNRNWTDFKNGFTDASGNNFWIGNEKLHTLTKDARYKAHFEVQAYSNSLWYVADYDYFIVDTEANGYMLHVWGFLGGNASDYMNYNNGAKFSTFDKNNVGGCATTNAGGFWYFGGTYCSYVGINSKINSGYGFCWWTVPGTGNILKASRMWLLCR